MKASYIILFSLLLLFLLGLFWFNHILFFIYGIPENFMHLDVDMLNYDGCIAAQNKVRSGAIIYMGITFLLCIVFSIISAINMRNTKGSKSIVFAVFGGFGISITIILLLTLVMGFIGAEIGRGAIG